MPGHCATHGESMVPVVQISIMEVRMFDLPYLVTHPLAGRIYKRHAELMDLVKGMAARSEERKAVERRISILEQYRLPKPFPEEQVTVPIVDESGMVIAQESSLRRRLTAVHAGRPEEFRIKVRVALEEKIIHPERTWRELSQQFGFNNYKDLERQVRLLKKVLQTEGIEIPTSADYQAAQAAFDEGMAQLHLTTPPE
jgi:hypothetical protein